MIPRSSARTAGSGRFSPEFITPRAGHIDPNLRLFYIGYVESVALGTSLAFGQLSRDELMAIAVARGCEHYAPFVPRSLVIDRPEIPQEKLACALFVGPADVDTFQSIRVGTMLLSDPICSAALVADAAAEFGVRSRVAHVAHLAQRFDPLRGNFWSDLARRLPKPGPSEVDFMPGVSRLSIETGRVGPGRGSARIWLRTQYQPRT